MCKIVMYLDSYFWNGIKIQIYWIKNVYKLQIFDLIIVKLNWRTISIRYEILCQNIGVAPIMAYLK